MGTGVHSDGGMDGNDPACAQGLSRLTESSFLRLRKCQERKCEGDLLPAVVPEGRISDV